LFVRWSICVINRNNHMDLIFYIYLAFLVFGGILSGASMLGGDHGHDSHGFDGDHGDTGHHLGSGDSDGSHQLESGHHFAVAHIDSHPVDTDGDSKPDAIQHHLSESAEAVKFISIRNFIYFSTLFGLTGTILSLMGFLPFLTFSVSFGMGTLASFIGYKTVKYLTNSESGEAVNIFNLKGRKGVVIIPAGKERKGRMRIEASGNMLDLIALVSDVSSQDCFAPGEEALIIDVKDNTVYIVPVDF